MQHAHRQHGTRSTEQQQLKLRSVGNGRDIVRPLIVQRHSTERNAVPHEGEAQGNQLEEKNLRLKGVFRKITSH